MLSKSYKKWLQHRFQTVLLNTKQVFPHTNNPQACSTPFWRHMQGVPLTVQSRTHLFTANEGSFKVLMIKSGENESWHLITHSAYSAALSPADGSCLFHASLRIRFNDASIPHSRHGEWPGAVSNADTLQNEHHCQMLGKQGTFCTHVASWR